MPRKGQKSVSWDHDPEILARLESVNQMMLRGAQRWQIAETLGVSLRTASRDMNRVRILRQRAAERDVEEKVNDSVSQFEAVRQEAWLRYDELRKTDKAAAARWLKIVIEATREIDDLWGLRRLNVEVSGPGGAPLETRQTIEWDFSGLSYDEVEDLERKLQAARRAANGE